MTLRYEHIVDVTLAFKDNVMVDFVLHYRARTEGVWHDIYRVDTCHGYLHEHRFWRSPKPIRLPRTAPLDVMFDFFVNEIKNNYEMYYKNAL